MGFASGSGGPLDKFKMTVGEGGIRVPLLIAGPCVIEDGQELLDLAQRREPDAAGGVVRERAMAPLLLAEQTDQLYQTVS